MTCWLNEQAATSISLSDRGLMLGDGHFTTVKVVDGQPQLWSLHQQRLDIANRRLGFAPLEWNRFSEFIHAVVQDVKLGVMRITLTRGSSGRGYQGDWNVLPNRIVTLADFPAHYQQWQQQGVSCGIARQQLSFGGSLVGLKTLGRAEQVLLKQELVQSDFDELLVQDPFNNLVESSAGNLFFIKGNTVVTPLLSDCGIAGVKRLQLMSLIPTLGFAVETRPVPISELPSFDAAFISNCLMDVVPINRVNDIEFQQHPLLTQLKEYL